MPNMIFSLVMAGAMLASDIVAPKIERAPLPDTDKTLTRIAFGSCSDEEARQPIWRHIAADNPDLFLYIGDNVYADYNRGQRIAEGSREELHFSYEALRDNRDFAWFQEDFPILAGWDDHDFGQNDAGEEFPHKQYAKDLMFGFFGVPQDASVMERDGVYHSATFGPEGQRVQIIMLDTRWFRGELVTKDPTRPGRSPYGQNQDDTVTMLGAEQWDWLAGELQKPADIRLLVSSIQVIAEGHHYEAWHTLPKERERLFDVIKTSGAEGVVLLSGDRHIAGLYRRNDVTDYSLYEITSSSLNLSFARGEVTEVGPHQIGRMYGPENYGMVSVDWAGKELFLEVKGSQGATVRSVEIPFEQLGLVGLTSQKTESP